MDPNQLTALVILLFVVMLAARLPIAFSMGLAGLTGLYLMGGTRAVVGAITIVPYSTPANYSLSVIMMFVLMSSLVYYSGVGKDMFTAAFNWFGHLPGGLAIATTWAGAAFAATCGSSMAAGASLARICIPEMKRFKYDIGLASGAVAAAGTLSPLIPPSIMLVVYAVWTQQNVAKQLMAGTLPGLLSAFNYSIMIYILVKLNPKLAPLVPGVSWRERVTGLRRLWGVAFLVLLVMGGLYAGLFSPTEAGAVGAAGALLIALALRSLNKKSVVELLKEATSTSTMIFSILIGAYLFVQFLSFSRVPINAAQFIATLPVDRMVILLMIIFLFMALGCLMEAMGMMLLTIPFIFPSILALGFDPIWFGVLVVKLIEIGMLTPPVGMNLFVISSVMPDVPFATVVKGSLPFIITDFVTLAMLIAFPQITLFLPSLMK